MTKKLIIALSLLLLPLLASADPVEIDGIYYNLIEETGQAEVTQNPDKYSGSVVIPESVVYERKDYIVTSISNAFYDCSDLTSVTIPNSVISIKNFAFENCSGLTSVIIPNSVTSIGEHAFYGCSGLTSVIIPNSVTSIGNSAFNGCSGLTSVTIPNSVTSICNHAFYNCSSITFVHITDIEAWCMISFGNYSSNPLYYAHHLYMNGSEITDLVIPNNVTSIGNFTFRGCSGLTSVTIPNSVTRIGNCAFDGCSGLTSVTIPNSVTSIGNSAFTACSGLTSITIPNSVTSIGVYAFSACSGLTSITIPNSVTSIGRSAFYECSGLTSVTIGCGIRDIGSWAFTHCEYLEDVYCYAEMVPSTNSQAFYGFYVGNATLHVPAESIDAYNTAYPWIFFKEIVALIDDDPKPTGVNTLKANHNVYPVNTYTVEGRLISNPQRGLNIIRMSDGTTRKVLVK